MDTVTVHPDLAPVLDRLLSEELVISPSYRGHFSNHTAMALVALAQMGAGVEVLETTLANHLADEAELRDDGADLEERLREIEREGVAAVVRRRVPALADGPGTALFHPLIRLGYGLEVGHRGQVAAALLDWERRHETLPATAPPADAARLRLVDAAASVARAAEAAGGREATFDLPSVVARPAVVAAIDSVLVDAKTLDDLSSFVLAAHLTAQHFISLHLVTGVRALRVVSGWLDPADAVALAGHTVVPVLAGYAATGAPALLDDAATTASVVDLPTPEAVAARAVADTDPHVIKLVQAALAEEQRTGDARYRLAAARVTGQVR